MKIYCDMTTADLYAARYDSRPEAPSVTLEVTSTIVGRKRAFTHDTMLTGDGGRHTRRRNSGVYGATGPYEMAATWMDWGWWIACMFRHEPTAIIGQYDDRDDFLETTARDMAYRLRIKDTSALNFQRNNAAIWEPGTSPFALVDRLCPPQNLVNLADRPVVEAYLAS